MFGIGIPELIIIVLILAILIVPLIFLSRILSKAGFSAWLSLLSLVPLLNLILLWVFAFIDWPNLDKKKSIS
jgi:hypothetical protein